MRIDAHHHLWRYTPDEFDWITEPMGALRRDFLADDLAAVMDTASADGAIAVQARQSTAETEWLLDVAATTPEIVGVVGWLDLREADLSQQLERFRAEPLLRGVRHVVQAEATGFLADARFNKGVSQLHATGLVYDILIHAGQLGEAIRFVDRHPQQSFVLDHLGKPRVREGLLEPWQREFRELAQRSNVCCKLSGLVTEADPHRWSMETLTPYVETALEAFGPDRLMIGTDWPVLTLGCSYARWWELVAAWTARLSVKEQAAILGATAQRVYGLSR